MSYNLMHMTPTKIWTREACIAAIRTFEKRYGRPPSAYHFNPSHARAIDRADVSEQFYADGDYPHQTTIQQVFGSWSSAIKAAGLIPRKRGGRFPQSKPRKTHCIHGHEYTPENSYIPPGNSAVRYCRTCAKARVR